MSKSIVRAACGLLILLVVIAGLAACTTMPEPEYASQITESTLQAMSDGDYAAFTQYFNPEAKAAIDEADFNTGSQEIKALIGDYIDKEFQKAETENGYIGVYYKADFSEEPEGVTVTVYFEERDGEMYIAAFGLKSPKLGGE
ncbi:hypothetical protein ES703_39780 [subsurface metagenome]